MWIASRRAAAAAGAAQRGSRVRLRRRHVRPRPLPLWVDWYLWPPDLVIIAAGELVTQGPVGQVVNSMVHTGRTLVRTPEPAKLTAALGSDATIETTDSGDLYVTGPDAATIGDTAMRAGIALHQLHDERPDLEDVFLELTKGKAAIR